MGLCNTLGNCPSRGDNNGMTGTVERFETKHEPGGKLGNTPEEQYIGRAGRATKITANSVVTLGVSKGWKFRCKPGDTVALWLPGSGEKAITYTLTNAALWRAIKNRGIGLT